MLVLAGGVVALLVGNHQQSVEAAERLHGVGSSAVAADPAAADPAVVGQAAQEKAAADQAAQEKAAADRAAQEKAAADQAAQEKAAREKAAREQAAADQAARKKAAREQAAADQAAADQAAQEKAAADQAAREKAAADQAAADQAAREKAAAAPHVIAGEMTAPGINGALVTQFGGYPGQPLNEFGMRDLNRLEAMINSLERGRTYPCPGGSGGGYDDIVAGAQVVVEDGTGAVLATTTLRGGRVNMQGCTFTFKVEVPDMPFYRIEVTHRGAITYSRADLNRDGWRVGMRL